MLIEKKIQASLVMAQLLDYQLQKSPIQNVCRITKDNIVIRLYFGPDPKEKKHLLDVLILKGHEVVYSGASYEENEQTGILSKMEIHL